MHVLYQFYRFHFNQHLTFHQQIGNVMSNLDAIVTHLDRPLLVNAQAQLAHFVRERILVNFLKESRPQRITDSINTANNLTGKHVDLHVAPFYQT